MRFGNWVGEWLELKKEDESGGNQKENTTSNVGLCFIQSNGVYQIEENSSMVNKITVFKG